MALVIKKGIGKGKEKKNLDAALQKLEHSKKLDTKLYIGKVKWDEDALAYQKRLRNKWD
jgi:hypothetical protein